jgi:hypothetical protein
MIAAIRSIEEWIASDKMLTDPLMIPTASFNIISKVLDTIERRAMLTLAFIKDNVIFCHFFSATKTLRHQVTPKNSQQLQISGDPLCLGALVAKILCFFINYRVTNS